jgi:flagellar assembly protein FliH
MMAAPAKFLFDTDFGRTGRAGPNAVSPAQHQAALAEAEARGFRSGTAAAQADAAADTERRLAAALTRGAAALELMARGFRRIEDNLEAEAIAVAVAMATKLAPALIAREPLAEVEALAAECFRQLVSAPHVVVRVNATVFEPAQARLGPLAATCGLEGRLIVLADDEIAPGDCRIEWADGGAIRDRAAVEAAVAGLVARYISVHRSDLDASPESEAQ